MSSSPIIEAKGTFGKRIRLRPTRQISRAGPAVFLQTPPSLITEDVALVGVALAIEDLIAGSTHAGVSARYQAPPQKAIPAEWEATV